MINVFTLTNINIKIIEGKSSKTFISEVCIKPVALRINRYTEVARSFKKVGDPWPRICLVTGYVSWAFYTVLASVLKIKV